ncbi:MAG: hypothetical protein JW836_00800 [Deltaproteobacteria bacterium]|nr:hypothetical protein [Deltaproteobacteria bacterium]
MGRKHFDFYNIQPYGSRKKTARDVTAAMAHAKVPGVGPRQLFDIGLIVLIGAPDMGL